jgi:hypothetical protein
VVEDGFADERAAGVAGAEEKYVHVSVEVRLIDGGQRPQPETPGSHAGLPVGVQGVPPQQFSVRKPNKAFILSNRAA